MNPQFPAGLPQPMLAGFEYKRDSGSIRTEVEQGPARMRKRFTSNTAKMSVAWTLDTDIMMDTFERFYRIDCAEGSAWFDMVLKLWDGDKTRTCRFVEAYSARPSGAGLWMVSAQIELRAN